MQLRILTATLLAGGCSLLCADYSPLPSAAYTGLGVTISLQSWEGFQSDGGGEFGGTVTPAGGNSSQTVNTNFWCVDYQLAFEMPVTSTADIVTLNNVDAGGGNPYVRYSDVTNNGSPQWLNTSTIGPDGSGMEALPSDPQSRFEMVAWLVMQYDYSTNPGGGPQDEAIQNAIWAITDNNAALQDNAGSGIYERGYQYTDPSHPGNTNYTLVDQALANYQTVGVGPNPQSWAIVSWGTLADGKTLGTGPYWEDPGGARQTFLVELDAGSPVLTHTGTTPTPEPGLYGILAAGLAGLCYGVRRRRR